MRPSSASFLMPLAGLAGCFAPSPPGGAPCAPASSAERCPSGLVCVMRMSGGAEVCMAPGGGGGDGGGGGGDGSGGPGDQDGDGHLDAADNCPAIANVDQADEDGDELGDRCDPCPPFTANADADGDGVGDSCDPRPQTAGDRIAAFEGFASGMPARWTADGMIVVGGGTALAMGPDGGGAVLSTEAPVAARVEIRAAATLLQLTGNTALGALGVVDRLEPNTDRTVACQLTGLASGDQQELRLFNTGGGMLVDSAPHAFTVGMQTELRLRRDGTSYACRATNPSLEIGGVAAFSPSMPRTGLRVRSAVALYQWVMIVTSP
jgi:Thrombospondin type 3 repeat